MSVVFYNFYMNDVLSDVDDLEKADKFHVQLIALLKSGGIELHKLSSNGPDLLLKFVSKNENYNFHSK